MKPVIRPIAIGTLLALSGPVLAQDNASMQLNMAALIKASTTTVVAPGRTRLDIVAEGAGKIVTPTGTVHFHSLCNIVDTLVDKRVVDGVGECVLTTTSGGTGIAHFQTAGDRGDRAELVFKGGSKDLAAVVGSVRVEATVNPHKVGKPVFFVENERGSKWE